MNNEDDFVVFGKTVHNPILKRLMYVIGYSLFIGALLYTPILLPMHILLRMLGMKGIYFVDGYFINITDTWFEPIDDSDHNDDDWNNNNGKPDKDPDPNSPIGLKIPKNLVEDVIERTQGQLREKQSKTPVLV